MLQVNKSGVVNLLKYYNYSISIDSSELDIAKAMLDAIRTNSEFTRQIIAMMQKIVENEQSFSHASGWGEDNDNSTASIISAALEGLGMVTKTWQNTANTKAQSAVEVAKIAKQKQELPVMQLLLIIGGGAVMLTLLVVVGIMVVRKNDR